MLLWVRAPIVRGGKESDCYYTRDDVMFRWHKQHPHPPLLLFPALFLCSPPFFSGAWNAAFRLVNSTIEMLRISTNQSLGAPSHRYHSNPSQPQRACTHVYGCTLMCISACLYLCSISLCFVCMCAMATHEKHRTTALQWEAFCDFIYRSSVLPLTD